MSGVVHKSVEMDGPTKLEDGMHSFTLIRKLGDNPFPFDFSGTIHHERVCHRSMRNHLMSSSAVFLKKRLRRDRC